MVEEVAARKVTVKMVGEVLRDGNWLQETLTVRRQLAEVLKRSLVKRGLGEVPIHMAALMGLSNEDIQKLALDVNLANVIPQVVRMPVTTAPHLSGRLRKMRVYKGFSRGLSIVLCCLAPWVLQLIVF